MDGNKHEKNVSRKTEAHNRNEQTDKNKMIDCDKGTGKNRTTDEKKEIDRTKMKSRNEDMNERERDKEKQEQIQEETIREITEHMRVPHSLEPEEVEKMLEKRSSNKKKQWWKYGGIAAAACVCLIVGSMYAAQRMGGQDSSGLTSEAGKTADRGGDKTDPALSGAAADGVVTETYIAAAETYDDVYACIEAQADRLARDAMTRGAANYGIDGGMMAKNEAAAVTEDAFAGTGYSETNVREEGVGEGDRFKTDGKNLYIVSAQEVKIVNVQNDLMEEYTSISLPEECYISEIYVEDDRLAVVYTRSEYEDAEDIYNSYFRNYTCTDIYDISDPSAPAKLDTITQTGYFHTMRVHDGYVYVLSDYAADPGVAREKFSYYIPEVQGALLDASDIYLPDNKMGNSYTIVTSFKLDDPQGKVDSKAVFGMSGTCYVSTENIYFADSWYASSDSETTETTIRKVSYKDGELEGVAQAKIKGILHDSFSLDEYEGNLRLVTTVSQAVRDGDDLMLIEEMPEAGEQDPEDNDAQDPEEGNAENLEEEEPHDTVSLYVLDEKLQVLGELHDLAPDERIYSARFMGDTGYFVTFRQVDPLFSVDLSDPKNPTIIGELKIPGFSEYLHPYGKGQLLGIGMDVDEEGVTTEGVKLSMFDISDPANVTEIQNYVMENTYGTDVAYDYKAVFVDTEKNLFGFTAYGDVTKYYVFTYDEEGGFRELFSRDTTGFYEVRGMYIGDTFYLVSRNTVESYTLDGFEKIDDIVL